MKGRSLGEISIGSKLAMVTIEARATPAEEARHPTLPNAPLVEAFFELRWALETVGDGAKDPGYPLVAGRLYDQIRNVFPYSETLPAAELPDVLTPYVVKQRFRVAEGRWPVVQIGPGVATVNYTDPYTWEGFRDQVVDISPKIQQSYEGVATFRPRQLLIRYIDALDFDPGGSDVLAFMRDQMHMRVDLPEEIAAYEHRTGNPVSASLSVELPLRRPTGSATLHIHTGERSGRSALIWDLRLITRNDAAANAFAHLRDWMEEAHDVAYDWFKALSKGNLYATFEKARP